ncbi:MAG: hypothetical protein ACOYYS_25005 [Chloroflexota bacterium]
MSQPFESNGKTYQYTSAVLMIYDPGAPAPKRYSLAALGREIGVYEAPQAQLGGYVLDGYRVWEEAVPIYERLGREVTGSPLTNTRYNAELRRYEQYFENMGFYRMEDDPTNSVNLLAYGAKVCGAHCSYVSTRDAVIADADLIVPSPAELQQAERVVDEAAARLGVQVTGRAITPAYAGADGQIEQVFENLVFAIDPADPGRARVRPLSDALNIRPDQLETHDTSKYFYAIEGGLGYNVPAYFMDYITQHGGIEISGEPMTREYAVNERVTRQCFANLCLEFHQAAPEVLRVRPQPVGYIYRDLNYRPSPADTPAPTLQSVSLKTWEDFPLVSQQTQQVIWAAIYDSNIPVDGVELRLTLTLPDGSQETYNMPLTDAQGQSSVTLPLISGANGTLVPYQVCVTSASMSKLCDQQSFVLWDTP